MKVHKNGLLDIINIHTLVGIVYKTKCVFEVSQNQSSIDVLPRSQFLIFHAVGSLSLFESD